MGMDGERGPTGATGPAGPEGMAAIQVFGGRYRMQAIAMMHPQGISVPCQMNGEFPGYRLSLVPNGIRTAVSGVYELDYSVALAQVEGLATSITSLMLELELFRGESPILGTRIVRDCVALVHGDAQFLELWGKAFVFLRADEVITMALKSTEATVRITSAQGRSAHLMLKMISPSTLQAA